MNRDKPVSHFARIEELLSSGNLSPEVSSLLSDILSVHGKGSAAKADPFGDVTRLKHINRMLLAIRRVNQLIVTENNPEQLLRLACSMLVDSVHDLKVWMALLGGKAGSSLGLSSDSPVSFVASGGFGLEFDQVRAGLLAGGVPFCMKLGLESGNAPLVHDCPDCPLAGDRVGFVRELSFDGVTYGVMVTNFPVEYASHQEELNLFGEVAGDLAFGLGKIARSRKLDASQRRYSEIFSHSRDGFVMVNRDGGFLDANAAYCEMLGYTIEELREMPDFYSITPARWHQWESSEIWEKRLLKKGYSGVYEKEYTRKDGTVFPVELSSYTVTGENGEVKYLWGTARDVTERNRAEEELREEEETVRALLNATSDTAFLIDPSGVVLEANDVFAGKLGLAKNDVIGANFFELLPEGLARRRKAWVNSVLTARSTFSINEETPSAVVHHSLYPVMDSGGNVSSVAFYCRDITETVLFQKKIQQARDSFETIYNSSTDSIFILDPVTGDILDVNQTTVDTLGYTKEEIKELGVGGTSPDNPEYSQGAALKLIRKAVEEGPQVFEWRALKKNGEEIWVEDLIQLVSLAGKDRILTVGRDITQWKKAETALRESEKRFRSFVEHASDMVYTVSPDGVFTYVSPNWEDFMGEPAEKALGRNFREYIHPEDAHLCAAFQKKIYETGKKQDAVEYRTRHADGSWRWQVSSGSPLFDSQGNIVETLGIVQDITEKKLSETQLKDMSAELEQILNSLADAVVFTDMNRKIKKVNTAFTRITGFTPEEVMGKTTRVLYSNEEEYRNQGNLRKLAETNQEWKLSEISHVKKDGTGFIAETMGTTVKNAAGKPVGFLAVVRDITEKKHMQERIRQMEKMESVGRLAGGVAHDFNNMLNVILGYTDMALEGLKAGDPIRSSLEEVKKAGKHSADLTRQLLAFARKQTVTPRVLDLNETIGSMHRMLTRLIGEDIELCLETQRSVFTVRIDPGQIDQILANLAINARDAIGLKQGRVTIQTSNAVIDRSFCETHPGASPGEYVLLRVIDNGRGMNEETIPHIFEPFFTTKGMEEGTGLGLATVYGIVSQNNGFIDVASDPGKGSMFSIYLPSYRGGESPGEGAASTETIQPGSETILLVEDEPAILKMTTTMLEMAGYTVVAADTPGKAIRLAREHSGSIHLLLSDVVMPEMNGRDLARNIISLYPSIKRLFMSGYTADVIAHQGVLDPGVNFIQKPFSRTGLIATIREILDRD